MSSEKLRDSPSRRLAGMAAGARGEPQASKPPDNRERKSRAPAGATERRAKQPRWGRSGECRQPGKPPSLRGI